MKRAKRVFAAVLSAALLCSCLPFSRLAAEPQQADLSFAQQFASPQGTAKPYIRWWVTPGLMNEQETKREIRQMAEAGFGGIELVAIVSMAPFGSDGWNPVSYTHLDVYKRQLPIFYSLQLPDKREVVATISAYSVYAPPVFS